MKYEKDDRMEIRDAIERSTVYWIDKHQTMEGLDMRRIRDQSKE